MNLFLHFNLLDSYVASNFKKICMGYDKSLIDGDATITILNLQSKLAS